MSASFSVGSSTGRYQVVVEQGLVEKTVTSTEEAHILADAFFRPHFHHSSVSPVFVEATEQAKSLDRMAPLIEQLRAMGANRSTSLVALGGGVIQDIAAFIASVYMRGIPWSYSPTTVLAMVDSCIGGKSSLNVGPYKNLIGTFHPPTRIVIDPTLAETLPRDQFAGGLIEAAKICFCRGPESFAAHLDCEPSTCMSASALESVIVNSLLAKKHFIEIDEFDKKERLLLNFGHTFGHALEGASHYGIPHGIAVGLGIQCSLAFQRQRGVRFSDAAGVSALEHHLAGLIAALPGISQQLMALDPVEVLERLASDKKHTSKRFTLILVSSRGEVILEQIDRSPTLDAMIQDAVKSTIESYQR